MVRASARMLLNLKARSGRPPAAQATAIRLAPGQTSPVISRYQIVRGRFSGPPVSLATPITNPTPLQCDTYTYILGPGTEPLFFKMYVPSSSSQLFVAAGRPLLLFAKTGPLLPLTEWDVVGDPAWGYAPAMLGKDNPKGGLWYVMAYPEEGYVESWIEASW